MLSCPWNAEVCGPLPTARREVTVQDGTAVECRSGDQARRAPCRPWRESEGILSAQRYRAGCSPGSGVCRPWQPTIRYGWRARATRERPLLSGAGGSTARCANGLQQSTQRIRALHQGDSHTLRSKPVIEELLPVGYPRAVRWQANIAPACGQFQRRTGRSSSKPSSNSEEPGGSTCGAHRRDGGVGWHRWPAACGSRTCVSLG